MFPSTQFVPILFKPRQCKDLGKVLASHGKLLFSFGFEESPSPAALVYLIPMDLTGQYVMSKPIILPNLHTGALAVL